MTIWQSLIQQRRAVPEKIKIATNYQWASPAFIDVFIKTAKDFGCSEEEITTHLNLLETNRTNHSRS